MGKNIETVLEWTAKETGIVIKVTKRVIEMLDEGNTVPFIARYRKELTGGLDEVQIKLIQDKWTYATNLAERKEEVIRLIDEQGKLTAELKKEIESASQLQRLEDLYRPYKQKRRTRATIAKEKGLEPFALYLWEQREEVKLDAEARKYFSEEHELSKAEDVMAGVSDIIAEWIADDAEYRELCREETARFGLIAAKAKDEEKDEKEVFKMYYEYSEAIRSIASHRVLALNRGEKEGILRVSVEPQADRITEKLERRIIKRHTKGELREFLQLTIQDSYKRLLQPSIEREIRNILTEKAEDQAIQVFAKNLNSLLLQPPLKERKILGVDPAFRTGCKLAVIDETGKMLDISVMYPTAPRNDIEGAERAVLSYMEKYNIGLIAIGNGTASRETEQFIVDVIQRNNLDTPYIIVNEAGASVYSASELAREEFPDLQTEERSAVSIARRVQDPLAELVKIDPQSIGVGQYQHDVSQKALTDSLGFVVETAVNQVGVNVNTASVSLLQYVSGLSKTVAKNIVARRDELGKLTKRSQLKDIPRLGAKTYEQSIGFLRIPDGDNPLDRTPIHPETYKQTKELLKHVGSGTEDIGTERLKDQLQEIDLEKMAEYLDIGVPTLQDMIAALNRPGRDPREDYPQPLLKTNVLSLEDLQKGMEMQGTVRNVVDFGVFVDIGVKQDGLVHISKLSDKFVKHPLDIVSVGDIVTVWVEDCDIKRGRIALSMVNAKG